MKTKWIAVISVLALCCLGATTIHFFTDYPNGVPVDSDFFVYQRNQTYGNASGTQLKSYLFSNPTISGNLTLVPAGSITLNSGNIILNNGAIYGNGVGLSNVSVAVYLGKNADFGTNETFDGTTTFAGTPAAAGQAYFFDITGATLLGGFDGTEFFGSLTNLVPGANVTITKVGSGANTYFVIASSASSTNSSTTATNMFTLQTNAMQYGIVTGALQVLNVSSVPSIATFDSAKQLTNGTVTSAIFLGTLSDDQFIQYDTNSIPSSGALTFRHSYFTNMQHDITMPAFTIVDATKYESFVLIVTNSDSSTHAWTVPAGCRVAIANGGGNKIYCTNATMTSIYVEHYGVLYTNAWKNDY